MAAAEVAGRKVLFELCGLFAAAAAGGGGQQGCCGRAGEQVNEEEEVVAAGLMTIRSSGLEDVKDLVVNRGEEDEPDS